MIDWSDEDFMVAHKAIPGLILRPKTIERQPSSYHSSERYTDKDYL